MSSKCYFSIHVLFNLYRNIRFSILIAEVARVQLAQGFTLLAVFKTVYLCQLGTSLCWSDRTRTYVWDNRVTTCRSRRCATLQFNFCGATRRRTPAFGFSVRRTITTYTIAPKQKNPERLTQDFLFTSNILLFP